MGSSGTAITSRVHSLNRPNMVSVGTIVWLSSELMFFAGLFAMYFTARAQAGGDWPPAPTELNLALAVPVTLVLIASSFTCQMGVFAAERGDVFGLRRWYTLTPKEPVPADDPIRSLDVSILQDRLLEPLLGIADPRTDKRIDFVGGIRGTAELERRVSSGECAAAFSMYPTTIAELMAIADAGETMPPKSTWFEPKLRSGLFVHRF